ncbi:putative killer cell immunoglobulin-like receptor-like protein KIR3DX1 [Oryx dammah]|uniref:putative killer cell immunoglobulin-like receptor-like protein KIR3DX1 n=1 Tax=Oryx dammah TaxID=59534 RepID=UPI001A9B8875|nr:putative killer cell immunoglobulin-like receptor-like protein KIR3DX1 [Oryx dammah]
MCPTLLSLLSLGFCVSLRIWAAMGEYDKPSLSAWPSPMVPLGKTVTLQCHFHSPLKRFRLFRTDGASLTELHGNHFNTFTLGPVTREHAGSYTCSAFSRSLPVFYRHSDPLQIVVTGVFTKPSISAHPGPIMRVGENVTLRCHSPLWFDKFILHKTSSTGHFQRCVETLTGGHATTDFIIGPMTLVSAGTYRCYGSLSHSPYEWSAPSDPVDIIIRGRSRKPSLSAQGGPVVRSGENVTLVCSSESAFDQFHLFREEEDLGRPLAGGQGPRGALQAEFPLGPGTPAHSGVYRCYGSFIRSPYSWSDSSDPLFLSVTESTTSTCPSPMDPHTTEEARLPHGHSSQLHLLLRLSVAFIYTSIFLAVLVCHWLPTKYEEPNCHWCSTHNHVAITEGEPKEDRTVHGEDPSAEDVIFVNLNHKTLSERLFTPTHLSLMHLSTKPSIYEEFDVNPLHADPDLAPSFEHTELQIEELHLFLKGFLRGHSSFSSKAAQQL